MEEYIVTVPVDFSMKNSQNIIEQLSSQYSKSFDTTVSKVIFDFSKCKTISPVGLIYIQMWKDSLIACGKKTFYRKSNNKTDSFLKKMNLLPHKDDIEDRDINKKYFFQIHKCKNMDECSEAHAEILKNVVQREKTDKETFCAIDYMLNELWDNAGVHGYECYKTRVYPMPVYMCALEEDGYYEISIGDRGQGIYSSLKKNNLELKGYKKKEAVKAAIQNGISGHPDGSPGFGLYCSAEFIRQGNGALLLWSSGCFLAISSKNDRIYNSAMSTGTLVSFLIRKDSFVPFEEVMGDHSSCSYSAQEYFEDMLGGLFDEQ